ncbi:MAG: phosphoribosyltransferase [Planctomycetota bacterium]|jgi:hypoxanthine phosphoribosyltransferase
MERPDIISEIAVDERAIRRCVRRLAREVVADYPSGSKVLAVMVLEGARRFAEDLLRAFLAHTSARFELAHVSAQSYHGGRESSGSVEIDASRAPVVSGRNVLVIDDVYDTGRTLSAVTRHIRSRGARSVKTCVLLEKQKRHAEPVKLDFLGTRVFDRYLVGYGLDHEGRYRDLPYVGYADGAGPG